MEAKEINILHTIILEVLGEQKIATLKMSLVSEKGYQNFLVKILEIIIGKEKGISLEEFLATYGLSEKLAGFQNKANHVLEEMAELVYEGYTSIYTEWLLETKNELFLTHLSFLKDLDIGVVKSERYVIKKRLSVIDEINAFEISDKEITAGFKQIERKRLKKRFEKLDLKGNSQHSKTEKPRTLKYSTVFILLAISTVALAISIPTVREFIIRQTKEIIKSIRKSDEGKKSDKQKLLVPVLIRAPEKDTSSFDKGNRVDSTEKSIAKPSLTDTATKKKGGQTLKKTKPRIGKINSFDKEKDYEDYFLKNENNLEYLEGIWDFQGVFSKEYYGYNATKIKFAIVKSGDRYEMAWLNKNGSKNNQVSQYYLSKLPKENGVYSLVEYANSKEINHTKVYLNNKRYILTFEIEINAERFEFPNVNSREIIHCKFKGIKRDVLDL